MDWQVATVMLMVAAAVLYLGRGVWRAWNGVKGGCGGGCGCGKAVVAAEKNAPGPTFIPADQITLRRRDPGLP